MKKQIGIITIFVSFTWFAVAQGFDDGVKYFLLSEQIDTLIDKKKLKNFSVVVVKKDSTSDILFKTDTLKLRDNLISVKMDMNEISIMLYSWIEFCNVIVKKRKVKFKFGILYFKPDNFDNRTFYPEIKYYGYSVLKFNSHGTTIRKIYLKEYSNSVIWCK